jgi:hypothetical protein
MNTDGMLPKDREGLARRGITRLFLSKQKGIELSETEILSKLPESEQQLGQEQLMKMVYEGILITHEGILFRISDIARNIIIERGAYACCPDHMDNGIKNVVEVCIVCQNISPNLFNKYGSFCSECWQVVTFNR